MKKFSLLFCLLIGLQHINAQATDFEDGTLQDWTDIDGNIVGMSIVTNPDNNSMMLQKICDGSNSAEGRMTIKNEVHFTSNEICYVGTSCVRYILMAIKNPTHADLYFRFGFRGIDGTKIVSDVILAEHLTSSIDIYEVGAFINLNAYTVVEGTGTITEVFEDVVEFRVIAGQSLSFDGEPVIGTYLVEHIAMGYLAAVEDNRLENVQIVPVPTNDVLTISSEIFFDQYRIYNLTGALVSEGTLEAGQRQIDVSNLMAGMYFLELNSGDQKTNKKFIKQ